MKLKGINDECRNDCMKDAFKKSKYKLRTKKVGWPRVKGPGGVRVEVSTGFAVSFVSVK
jgi:hypothetical protein